MENNEVIRRFNERDELAFNFVFKLLYPKEVRWAASILHDDHEAEDVCVIVFSRIWNSSKEFIDYDHIRRYIHESVKNECLNYKRLIQDKNRKITELIDSEIFEEVEQENILLEVLHKAINSLPDHYRKLMILDLQGYSDKEIMELEGMKSNTLYIKRHRALKLLKSLLNK